jgi:ribosome-binding ATPase YchF (GTP1/OBG family)
MRVGIVGFRGAGKSTIFKALTGLGPVPRKKGSKPQVGVIKVPDPRVEKLRGILKLEKTTLAEITIVDFVPGKGVRALNP